MRTSLVPPPSLEYKGDHKTLQKLKTAVNLLVLTRYKQQNQMKQSVHNYKAEHIDLTVYSLTITITYIA